MANHKGQHTEDRYDSASSGGSGIHRLLIGLIRLFAWLVIVMLGLMIFLTVSALILRMTILTPSEIASPAEITPTPLMRSTKMRLRVRSPCDSARTLRVS